MPEVSESRYLTTAGWDSVPHLDDDTKRTLLASTQPYLRDARSKGIPSLGSGAIYPVEEAIFLCDPFAIPAYWPRVYGLDVGWNRTAALWGAIDRDSGTVYLYTEHYLGEAQPSTHASAIRSRGEWIPGVIDPAAHGRQQSDGSQLLHDYRELGLKLTPAINAVEAGIQDVWERLSTGKIKVFNTLQKWRAEHRLYRRDEKGKIVKANDHLMDAMRYLIVSGLERAIIKPVVRPVSSISPIGDHKMGY